MAAVADLFEGDSDDPEEQRRCIEARQTAEKVGALLALAILLTERVLRRRDAHAEDEEAALRQLKLPSFSMAEEQQQADTDWNEPEWKEGDALTFEWEASIISQKTGNNQTQGRWTVLGRNAQQSNEQKKKAAAERIWLNYYNQYLYEHGFITELERNRMKNLIECRKPSAAS